MKSVKELSAYVAEKLAAMSYPREMGTLDRQVRYGLEAGGKHIRPVLTLAVCEALGGDHHKALNQALGVEMFHNFTLVHDDVMDRSDLRRGKPTVRACFGDDMAILSGDAMLTFATMTVAAQAGEALPRVLDVFNRGALEVYAGQELDMQFESRLDVTTREYLNMILLKTSALLRCACRLGAVMAEADDRSYDAISAYAVGLGMAFQLRDDYLDIYGNEATFGKPIGGDILNNKKTWFLTSALESERGDEVRELLQRRWTDPQLKITAFRALYDDMELPKKCNDLIEQYSRMAICALDDCSMSASDRDWFAAIVNDFTKRSV